MLFLVVLKICLALSVTLQLLPHGLPTLYSGDKLPEGALQILSCWKDLSKALPELNTPLVFSWGYNLSPPRYSWHPQAWLEEHTGRPAPSLPEDLPLHL